MTEIQFKNQPLKSQEKSGPLGSPTPEDIRRLIENKVREEILYREALALGLDKGDNIVKRRLVQKMEFVHE